MELRFGGLSADRFPALISVVVWDKAIPQEYNEIVLNGELERLSCHFRA